MTRTLGSILLTFALSGCFGEVGVRGTAVVETPDLVEVSPGVQVIADYDEPIFFSNGLYWWNVDGLWYRSNMYTGGWAVGTPPMGIVRIGAPHGYSHYRPQGYVGHRRPVPVHRIQRPVVRDHRTGRR